MVNHRCKSITVGGHFVYGRIIYWYLLFRYDECVLSFCEKTKQLFYGKSLAGIFHSRNWQYDWCSICGRVRMVGYACDNRSYVFMEYERNPGEKQLSIV